MKKVVYFATSAVWAILLALFILTDYEPSSVLIGLAMLNSVVFILNAGLEAK
ncbi:hypothetical protein [Bacillus sp. JJ722]|uniref:hypothetical protein n=1 Tax=Bacillus sp. JJ722 TaxID=3122973 RepID=UPI002FFE7776